MPNTALELKKKLVARQTPLRRIDVAELSIRRKRSGEGFTYVTENGRALRDTRTLARIKRLAVPPAYQEVLYAADPGAHIQAVGRDSAGRTQYRYHPEWDKVREQRKARHLARLIRLLPQIRKALSRNLRGRDITREYVLAAVIDLIACTAIRPGSEQYARDHGTRGAATLLQSDVVTSGNNIALSFRGKGGKHIELEVRSPRLARVLKRLKALPGKRLFKYKSPDGAVINARRRDVNSFLQEIGSPQISLKDFRTMTACARALEHLSTLEPRSSERGRRRQVNEALVAVSEELANTPAICRKSYVHNVVVKAFETGSLTKLSRHAGRSPGGGERMLKAVLEMSTPARTTAS